jgi:hypothetical protein
MEEDELKNWLRCADMMTDLQALTVTNGKTPVRKIKNNIIKTINHYEKEFSLLTEERKEKSKEKKEMLLNVLKDICILLDDFYIEEEKQFIKKVFKDGGSPIYEKMNLNHYYRNIIS